MLDEYAATGVFAQVKNAKRYRALEAETLDT
jgi:hypothetical protein